MFDRGIQPGQQVQYAALPNYEDREEEFNAESVLLRRRFTDAGKHITHEHASSLFDRLLLRPLLLTTKLTFLYTNSINFIVD